MLQDTPVLVTGASGFIGSRLAQILAQDHGAQVTGVGRTFGKPAPAGVTHEVCDLRDTDRMAELIHGQEVLFLVAAWMPGRDDDEATARALNVDGPAGLIAAAAQAGVKRVVMVSSVAAYGLPAQDLIAEDTPLDITQRDLYGRTKALGEHAATAAARSAAMELAIVRPGMVYGPGSRGWTKGMYRLVKRGTPVLFGSGGNAYPVYVDDIVDLLIRAGTRDGAAGEAFNGVDHSIGWPEFFGYYGAMAGRSPRRLPLPVAQLLATAGDLLPVPVPLSRDSLRQYRRNLVFPTDKAVRLLDWHVQVPLAEGMRRSEQWLRQEGIATGPGDTLEQ